MSEKNIVKLGGGQFVFEKYNIIYPTDRKLKTKNYTNCKRHLVNSLAFRQDNHTFFPSLNSLENVPTHIIILCVIYFLNA